jgi:hypothetical protein
MYKRWCEIDDNEEFFLTILRQGDGNRKTTDEDDETLAQTALQNNFSSIKELRALPEVASNERLSAVCDRTLRNRLKNQGF